VSQQSDSTVSQKLRKLSLQRDSLLERISNVLEDVSTLIQMKDCNWGNLPQELDRLSRQLDEIMPQIQRVLDEKDEVLEKGGAAEFVRNYIQKPGK